MEASNCSLCGAEGASSTLDFRRVSAERGAQTDLHIAVCDPCAGKLEKHLKRAIPKRLMTFSPLDGRAPSDS